MLQSFPLNDFFVTVPPENFSLFEAEIKCLRIVILAHFFVEMKITTDDFIIIDAVKLL